MDYRPVPLAGRADEKVVDIGIQRTLDALLERDDADVRPGQPRRRLRRPARSAARSADRRVGLIGFREFTSTHLVDLGRASSSTSSTTSAPSTPTLPRVRIIPLDEFDPTYFLR